MIYFCFSVKDHLGDYAAPFLAISQANAKRTFSNYVNMDGSQYGMNPGDFDLYEVGSFDSVLGVFDAYDHPIFVCRAIDLLKKE